MYNEKKNQTITDPKSIAEESNNYFSTIADSILLERKYEGNKSFKDYLKNPSQNSLVLDPVSEDEIIINICNLKQNKASGPYSIPTNILHIIRHNISNPLSKIINMSFSTGVHPTNLKTSKTVPIFKKGSRMSISNYRPISLLSNLNKIFEKVMFERGYSFLEDL